MQQQQQQQQVTPSTSPLGGGVGGLGNGTYFQTSQRTGSVSSTPAFPVGSRHTTPSPTHSFHSQYNSGYNRGGGSGIGWHHSNWKSFFGNNGNPTIGSGAGVGSNSGAGGFRNNSDSVYSPGQCCEWRWRWVSSKLQFQQQQQQQSHSQQQQQQQSTSNWWCRERLWEQWGREATGAAAPPPWGARRSVGNFGSGGSAGGSGNGRDFSPGGDMLERLKIVERKLRFALVDEREGGGGETNGDDYGEESVGEVMASIECMVDVLLGVR
ncbi:hypothetical protein BDR26DRAFT_867321 [Obelidium mucronatum]|nr:hypothetical protein BDR26DRAFT_867321 [Obelidium mucronatum]